MTMKNVHLNLLKASERRTSSPVRPKVLLPVLSGFLLAGMIVWWVFLLLNEHLSVSDVRSLRADIAAKERQHAEICSLKDELKAKGAEVAQLQGYMKSRLTWGRTLAALAQNVPESIQITKVEITEPPVQNLQPPPGVKAPALLGPTNTVEGVYFRVAGRTAREKNLFSLLTVTAGSKEFNANLARSADGQEAQKPRIRQFQQDATVDLDGQRGIVFDLEYATKGRNFAP